MGRGVARTGFESALVLWVAVRGGGREGREGGKEEGEEKKAIREGRKKEKGRQ